MSDQPSIIPAQIHASGPSDKPTPAEALALVMAFMDVADPESRRQIIEFVKRAGSAPHKL